ncbi:MAPK kinase substrate protein-like protein, partial [Tanacetum coccineum]
MEALPRSEISFRRSGSSGLVWDDKLLSVCAHKVSSLQLLAIHRVTCGKVFFVLYPPIGCMYWFTNKHDLKPSKPQTEEEREKEQQRSEPKAYKSVEVEPTINPSSPKVSGCCAIFGKPVKADKNTNQKHKAKTT